MTKRRFSEVQKKQVAARQRWACSACARTLEATFEVDHTKPLWEGGPDSLENATAMCPNCHRHKTQAENVSRASAGRALLMSRVRAEETERRRDHDAAEGYVRCVACGLRRPPFEAHDVCLGVEKRVAKRVGGAYSCERDTVNEFDRFRFTAGL